ncbi:MAG: flagellar hook-length control protein FliK [Desulfobacterales bacterium]|nr:flagellar hook-length control protein FliK [Desulfobacterales bacterium]
MLNDIDHILISNSKLDLGNKADHSKTLPVAKGEVVEGRIIKSIPPHHALILIKGKQLVARTRVPLRPGEAAFFKVEQTAPQCVLKLIELGRSRQNGLSGLLKMGDFHGSPYKLLIDMLNPLIASFKGSNQQKLPAALLAMWALLNRVSLRSQQEPYGDFLKSFIAGSGMIWEHKLRSLLLSGFEFRNQAEAIIEQDLKALALKLSADAGPDKLFSRQAMTGFLDGLEQLQLLNLSGLEGRGKLLFIIPMQWHDRFTFAQILVDLAGKRADGHREHDEDRVVRLSLFLEMSRLGPVRVDASVFQKAIRVCFLVCNEEIQSIFEDHTDVLVQQVERHGFSLQDFACRLEEPGSLAQTSLVDALIDPEEHYISLVV